jgi:hypothetical protein
MIRVCFAVSLAARILGLASIWGRGIWVGSYVEPWLFRACIRQGGKPGDCSDDANVHP